MPAEFARLCEKSPARSRSVGTTPSMWHRIPLPNLLEIEEEEGMVFDDRAADREAILIAHVIGLFAQS